MYVFLAIIDASKPRSVNLNLETVLEFDKKASSEDLNLLNQVQEFIDRVKSVIDKDEVSRRSLNGGGMSFSDFLINAFETISKYDNDALGDLLTILDDEIRRYHYKGCKFYEVLENDEVRKFVADNLDALKLKSIRNIRNCLKMAISILKGGNSDRNTREFLRYVNSMYQNDARKKFSDVLKNLKAYSYKNRRNGLNLIKIVRSGLRSVVFDHYSDLTLNARKDFNLELDGFWNSYKEPLRIQYSVWTHNGRTTASSARNHKPGKSALPLKHINRDNFKNNQFYPIKLKPQSRKPIAKAGGEFIDLATLSDSENETDISAVDMPTKKADKEKKQAIPDESSSEEDISIVNSDYRNAKNKDESSIEDVTTKASHVRTKRLNIRKSSISTRKVQSKPTRKRKIRPKTPKARHTATALFDYDASKRRQTVEQPPSERLRLKAHKRPHVTSPDTSSDQSRSDKRGRKLGKLKQRFNSKDRRRHNVPAANIRRRIPGHVIHRLSSAEGMSIESGSFASTSLRKFNSNTTDTPTINQSELTALEKIKALENELKYVKEKMRVKESAVTFAKLSFWRSTHADTRKPISTQAVTNIPLIKPTSNTTTMTTTASLPTVPQISHLRQDTVNITNSTETVVHNESVTDNYLNAVAPFANTIANDAKDPEILDVTIDPSKHVVRHAGDNSSALIQDDLGVEEAKLDPSEHVEKQADNSSTVVNHIDPGLLEASTVQERFENETINTIDSHAKNDSMNTIAGVLNDTTTVVTDRQTVSATENDLFDVDDTLDFM